MLRLLHDLGLSWQKTRRCMPKPIARRRHASKKIPSADRRGRTRSSRGERLEVWFQDEALVGQIARLCRRSFERGMRPRGLRDLRHQTVYLLGAVCPERVARVALVLPSVRLSRCRQCSTRQHSSSTRCPCRRVMDRAGWHIAKKLVVPTNLTPLFLPPIARAQRHRTGLALSPRALPLAPPLAHLRRHPRCLLCRLEALLDEAGRIRSLCSSTGPAGQNLMDRSS